MKKKCPLCNGCGEIELEVKLVPKDLERAARNMRKEGFTIRQIAKALGKKHPGSISHLLSKSIEK